MEFYVLRLLTSLLLWLQLSSEMPLCWLIPELTCLSNLLGLDDSSLYEFRTEHGTRGGTAVDVSAQSTGIHPEGGADSDLPPVLLHILLQEIGFG